MSARLLHLELGNFRRAHQAIYSEDTAGEPSQVSAGITGVDSAATRYATTGAAAGRSPLVHDQTKEY